MPVWVKSPLHFLYWNWRSCKTAKNNCSLIHSTKNTLRASYLVSYRIARKGVSHTIAEDVCLPACQRDGRMYDWRERSKKVGHDPGVQQHCVAPHRCFVHATDYISRLHEEEWVLLFASRQLYKSVHPFSGYIAVFQGRPSQPKTCQQIYFQSSMMLWNWWTS